MGYHRAYFTCDMCHRRCGDFNSEATLSVHKRKKDERGENDFDKQTYLCFKCAYKIIKIIRDEGIESWKRMPII